MANPRTVAADRDHGLLAQSIGLRFGNLSAAPTVDCNGNALGAANKGASYFNDVTNRLNIWDGTAWCEVACLTDITQSVICENQNVSITGGAVAGNTTFTTLADIQSIMVIEQTTLEPVEICWEIDGTNANQINTEAVCDIDVTIKACGTPV